jgi:glyceraldehyde 3-phosphate dehydrogenase
MPVRVAINGFGRIGRSVFRAAYRRKDVEFVAVNDLGDADTLAHLLKYDSLRGTLEGEVSVKNHAIVVEGKEIKTYALPEPEALPWGELDVDVVLESTGRFTHRAGAAQHINAGAKKVVISAPATNPDVTFVVGINDGVYDRGRHHVISMASCTTNCLAPIAKVLLDEFGIEYGFMTTVHGYTNDQTHHDGPHKDLRRARAVAHSIIPTTTTAIEAIAEVIPALAGKLNGIAVRVPTPKVALVDLVAMVSDRTTKGEVNDKLRTYAEGPMKNILFCAGEPLISSDFNGNPYSSIVDLDATQVIAGNMVRVLSWYDNEWGFATRMAELFPFLMG